MSLQNYLKTVREKFGFLFIILRLTIKVFDPKTKKLYTIESASNIYEASEDKNLEINQLLDEVELLDIFIFDYIDKHLCKNKNSMKLNGYFVKHAIPCRNNKVEIIDSTNEESIKKKNFSDLFIFSDLLKKNSYAYILQDTSLTKKKIQDYYITHQSLYLGNNKQYIVFFEAIENEMNFCCKKQNELIIHNILKEFISNLECNYFHNVTSLPLVQEPHYLNIAYWIKKQHEYFDIDARLKNGSKIANIIYLNCIPQRFYQGNNKPLGYDKNFLGSLRSQPSNYESPHPVIQTSINEFYERFLSRLK